ncbi:SPOR domain-containing protein [Billgrantia tianxiuensis]|jgi:cell division protein FtsN|uniref:SPOR domain-containing protein n=1 Tax=Billgrantia tianxiuensis TaxID=2497861 RepID=A0A6I6SKA9_9GAMM|nr:MULTISPECIES: SPOR domain-containing protein [Halomonas]MCE8033027.1 SPOR domain-containing protein [Halomonas sp. MCCC 1A11057]QHC48814.1 SPOR domain-containing protein [Halomonas tianxiuensis]
MAARRTPKKRGATTSRKRTPARREGFRLPGWVWGVGGVVAGFLLAQHQHGSAPWQEGSDSPLANLIPRTPTEVSEPAPTIEPREPRMPTFEFYTLLPEEVVAPREVASTASPPEPTVNVPPPIDGNAAAEQAPADDPIAQVIAANLRDEVSATPASEAAAPAGTRYMLQAASFRQPEDAEQLRQRLRNLSLMAQVSQVQSADGQTWHRVMVGPYDDTRELNRAEDLMVTQGITPLRHRATN